MSLTRSQFIIIPGNGSFPIVRQAWCISSCVQCRDYLTADELLRVAKFEVEAALDGNPFFWGMLCRFPCRPMAFGRPVLLAPGMNITFKVSAPRWWVNPPLTAVSLVLGAEMPE